MALSGQKGWMFFMIMQSPCLVNANALPVIVAILSEDSDGEREGLGERGGGKS
jgi:hypothetical protein